MKERMNCFKSVTRLFILVLFAVLFTGMMSTEGLACLKVKNTEWEGKGKVEVHFPYNVKLRKAQVIVTDAAGKKHSARILKVEKREVEFRAADLRQGETYSFTIRGIKKKSKRGSYGTAQGSFTVPVTVNGITMKETDINVRKQKISFEFLEKVNWKKASVSISDGNKEYVVKILGKNKKEIKVKTKGLKSGKQYIWKIKGIRRKGTKKYVTISGFLTVP